MSKIIIALTLAISVLSLGLMLLGTNAVIPRSTLPSYVLPPALQVSEVYRVAPLTGQASQNATGQRFGLLGTDLGLMWDDGAGRVMVAFGDSYGEGWGGCGAGPRGADWRSNTLAFTADTDPRGGLNFSGMVEDRPGHAKELLPSRKLDGWEETVIPTAGISVGTTNYLFYMSVNRWVSDGMWYTNYAGVAYSTDEGQNWTVSPMTRWENDRAGWDDHFQQMALTKADGYVYMFGTPNGRLEAAYLARVEESRLLDKASYQYWDGHDWQLNNEPAAVPILPGPVGEMSVVYNSYLKRWLMTYLDEGQQAIVVRSATELTGAWSAPVALATSREYPQLYGGFIHPWFNDSPDLYFTMSQWCAPDASYRVSLMHARLGL